MPFTTNFVRPGQSLPQSRPGDSLPRRPLAAGTLGGFSDWLLIGNGISEKYQTPTAVAITDLRPDICLISHSTRKCILLELTVPFEDNILQAAERKIRKYNDLQREIVSNGYSCKLYSITVGCRGNYTGSLRICLRELGLSKSAAESTCRRAALAALRCSYRIYLSRKNAVWQQ